MQAWFIIRRMNSHEDWMVSKIDRERRLNNTELSPVLTLAYEKAAQEILASPDYAIQPTDFISVYGEKVIAEDIAHAARLSREFELRRTPEEKKMKKIADVFEAVVLMQSELSEWFGTAQTLKTAPYDDYENKVDMITEWFTPEEGSHLLALAVDVTFSTRGIQKKLTEIKTEIDRGRLGSIKYFTDERGDFIGTRNNVPRTVIGVSESVVEELANLWIHKKNKLLGEHPVQRLFLDEMESQLSAMHDYALKQGKTNAVLAYRQALGVVQPIRAHKLKFRSSELSNDRVAKEIALTTEAVLRASSNTG